MNVVTEKWAKRTQRRPLVKSSWLPLLGWCFTTLSLGNLSLAFEKLSKLKVKFCQNPKNMSISCKNNKNALESCRTTCLIKGKKMSFNYDDKFIIVGVFAWIVYFIKLQAWILVLGIFSKCMTIMLTINLVFLMNLSTPDGVSIGVPNYAL